MNGLVRNAYVNSIVLSILSCVFGYFVCWYTSPGPIENANEVVKIIRADFRIVDNEGYEVDSIDFGY